ncbi:MAG: hypothetical protein U0835_23420 [Isosphaeraceae bacterium]
MTSQARIDANRRNARKSTGPRTAAGKEAARFNALKHGARAETAVLPHEDAGAYEKRLEAWTRQLAPGDDIGGYLAERAVKLSWQLDRADAHERAVLARRTREIPRERDRSRRRRVAERVRQVITADPPRPPRNHVVLDPRPPYAQMRRDRLVRLKATALGCKALIQVWNGMEANLAEAWFPDRPDETPGAWIEPVASTILRLMGIPDEEEGRQSGDPRVRRVAETARAAGADARKAAGRGPAGQSASIDEAAARRELKAVVETERRRLSEQLAVYEAEVPDPAAEDAARVSFDPSPEGERVHRYQNQWGRALLQILREISRRNAEIHDDAPAPEPTRAEPKEPTRTETPPVSPTPDPEPTPTATERSQSAGDKPCSCNDLSQQEAERSHRPSARRPAGSMTDAAADRSPRPCSCVQAVRMECSHESMNEGPDSEPSPASSPGIGPDIPLMS